ncbi:MAG TPA: efflux RND transporter periplasmic adaptor subunit [Pirellulaceae bacterium]|nr:efflux RND transporter periplasmic adaptor subunit [Pirellulaceae bacterium]
MRWLGLTLTGLAIAAGGFGLGWYVSNQRRDKLSPATATTSSGTPVGESTVASNKVVAQGRLLPYGGLYQVIIPPGQRIERLLVKVGDDVRMGTTQLAELAGDPLLKKQVELAQSRAADSRRELELQLLQADNQVLAAQAALESARLTLLQAQQQEFSVQEKRIEQAQIKVQRLEALLLDAQTSRLISAHDVADQRLELESAQLQLAQARKLAEQQRSAAELGVANAEQQLAAAQRSRDAMREALDSMTTAALSEEIARLQLEAQQVVAPVSGQVIRLFAKQGEAVQSTPLLQIGDLSRMECVAEVVDRLARQVAEGQTATIRSPALSQDLRGRVTHVESLVGPATLIDPSPLAMMDRRTVEVRIELDEASTQIARSLIHLQVTVEIAVDR